MVSAMTLVMALLLASCKSDTHTSGEVNEQMSKAMVFIDSLPLPVASESGAIPAVARSDNGSLYFLSSDSTVTIYSSANTPTREFRVPPRSSRWTGRAKAVAVYADSLIGFLSSDGRAITIASLRSQQAQWSVALPAAAFDIRLSAGGAHVASFAGDSGVIWRIPNSDTVSSSSLRQPPSYATYPQLRAPLGDFVFHANRRSGMLIFPADAHLFFWFPSGRPDSIYLPPRRRFGTQAVERLKSASPASLEALRLQVSIPRFVGVLSDSTALVVYRDSTSTPKEPSTRTYYALIVNAKRSRVCLDISMPHLANREVRFLLHQDTLEAIASSNNRPSNTSLSRFRFRIAIESCGWIGVQRGI